MIHLHTVTASEAGLLSNSYVVEGEAHLVVVDPPMLLSDARALAARVAALGKPLGAIIVTHAHPDHANGAVVLAPVPIVALASTADVLTETAEPKRAQWTPVFGEDYPQAIRLPDRRLANDDVFELDELRFRVTDLGAGECASMALWVLESPERIVFSGDFVYPGVHGWLAEGRTAAWLGQLDVLASILQPGDVLLPGHGSPAPVTALDEQRAYLEAFREIVGRHGANGASRDNAADAADTEIRARYPTFRLPALVRLGIAGVASELARA